MDTKKLGRKIKIVRVELGMSQAELAKAAQTQQKAISDYETGKVAPSLETFIKIVKVLKMMMRISSI